MDETEIEEINTKDAREVFEHEENRFSPWLKRNIQKLEQERILGFELGEIKEEVCINNGQKRADLVGEIPNKEGKIIIENQFGDADPNHFGRALMYSTNVREETNVDIIVWIAEQFEEEYINTIKMINERTDEKFGVYAIEFNIIQIGNESPHGVYFNPVVKPNNLKKPEPEIDRTQREFWRGFVDRIQDRVLPSLSSSNPSPSGSHHIDVEVLSETYIRPTTNYKTNDLYTLVRLFDRDFIENKENKQEFISAMHQAISEYDVELDKDISNKMDFIKTPSNQFDKIRIEYTSSKDINFSDRSNWEDYQEWIADTVQVFGYALKQLTNKNKIKK